MFVKTTCPRDCYDTCGIEVEVENGNILRVGGDPSHPYSRGSLCGKCTLAYNGAFLDSTIRLARPLKRIGKKGEGIFEPVTWDEALNSIASKLSTISMSDPGRIFHAHYTGTCSLIANKFPMRFFHRLGATEVEPDTICNMAGHKALEYLIGTSLIGFDPRTANQANSIFVWGANPSATAPHAHQYWLKETAAKIVVIDPIRHPTAERADLYLQPRPGSDAALAFSLMYVLLKEDRLNIEFLKEKTLGWDDLKKQILKCPPRWGAAETGIPERDIVAAANIYGEGPALLWIGQGLQRQKAGGNIVRSCALLPVVTGNFGKPGSGLLYLNGSGRKGVDSDYLTGSRLTNSYPSISHMDLAETLENKHQSEAFICWNINPAVSNPEQSRLREALCREDLFTVVVDIFETDTTDYADYILPAASFLEFDDLVSGYFNLSFSAQAKVTQPHGQSLPNQEIFRQLSQRMGFSEPELYESDETIIDKIIKSVGVEGGFESLKSKGTIWVSNEAEIQFPNLEFPTPSGKIEIYSSRAASDGLPPLPESTSDAPTSNGKFRLISPASRWLMNGSYANDEGISKKLGPPVVTINPMDASRLGLKAGQMVSLGNDTGSLKLLLEVSNIVGPGVAMSVKGRWPRLSQKGFNQANVNILNAGTKSDMGSSSSVHNIEVTITAAKY